MNLDGSVGPVICVLAGEIWKSTGELNINEFSEDCDIFSVGQFVFDLNGAYILKEDESNYKHLK